jgi:hypothetical protein
MFDVRNFSGVWYVGRVTAEGSFVKLEQLTVEPLNCTERAEALHEAWVLGYNVRS